MYWRVRKISPEQVAKTYGVHAVCAISVICNVVLFTKIAPSNKLNAEQRINFDTFARQVTRHVVDSCFLTYEASMYQLAYSGTKAELAPNVAKELGQAGVIPPTHDEMKAIGRQLKDTKSVSSLSIRNVKIEEPSASTNGLVPIVIEGDVVKMSAEGLMGPAPVKFRMLVGQRGGDTPLPVVAKFMDASNEPPSQEVPQ